ncbi:hypothetical protein C0Q88_22005 [Ralstonia pickettii]|uniref:Uncharacterized protein n=1 Tax=Ralstonia pickettii TaxID=329 RepID=A0A2N4TLC5_RALPI|nr:hypothetical protein [Ralstonia pickettii]PLC40481.1 hypothetical protein C0Q88_22005 [Ralstonia pickettii]
MKLKATYETEVYISKGGYLCIRQKDQLGNDDPVVMLSPAQAKLVADEMLRLTADAEWWEESDTESEAE